MSRLADLLVTGRPLVMGILNVTPDSFSDGGKFLDTSDAMAHARKMIAAGADLIDIGGESTRPGAATVSVDEELSRVIPVIEAIRAESAVAISIDTSKPDVMVAASKRDIDLINDVRALRSPGALRAAAQTHLPVCLMHMQGEPDTMQRAPAYEDLVAELEAFFQERVQACEDAGIEKSRLILDVGFGFGKTPAHNLSLINRLGHFNSFNLPLLVGLSRKSTIGKIASDRLIGSIAGALMALEHGAQILRVHDVPETIDAIRVWQSIKQEQIVEQ